MLATSRARVAIAELVRRFRDEKLHVQVLDFADQNRLAGELASSAEVGRLLRERFELVLLDEYQDTSLVQRLLMQRLFGDGHPVTAVGDPCQAIYGFRGASVDNIDNFTEHFRCADGTPARIYSLADNHRSAALVIAAANRSAEPLRAVHPTVEPLVQGALARGRGTLICGMFETAAEEIAWITARIKELRPTVEDLSDVAVLVRDGPDGDRVYAALLAADVPVQLEASDGFLRDPAVLDLRCILEVLADPTANVALARLLAGPRWRIGPRDLWHSVPGPSARCPGVGIA
jgi:DNA helicase-2/ATP-dependent DNA helicase PcrA